MQTVKIVYQRPTEPGTYVEDDKKDNINTIENDKDPEKPPSCARWKEKGETAPGMVEQEIEFFPYSAFFRDQ